MFILETMGAKLYAAGFGNHVLAYIPMVLVAGFCFGIIICDCFFFFFAFS